MVVKKRKVVKKKPTMSLYIKNLEKDIKKADDILMEQIIERNIDINDIIDKRTSKRIKRKFKESESGSINMF